MTAEFGIHQRLFSGGLVRLLLAGLLLANGLAWWQWLRPGSLIAEPRPYQPELTISVLDVGQGAAALIETPRGRKFLLDAGPWERDRRATSSPAHLELQKRRIDHLDGLLLTHFHNDRLEGAHAVLEHCRVDRVWENGSDIESPAFQDYRAICARLRVPRVPVKAGDTLDFGAEVFAAVLRPADGWLKAPKIEQHDGSIMLLLRYGKTSFLFPGDVETDAQDKLAVLGDQLKAVGMLLPISGSAQAFSESFFRVVQPDFACISVGADNLAGFPETPVLNWFQKEKIEIYRTDSQGTITIRLGGRSTKDFQVRVDRSL